MKKPVFALILLVTCAVLGLVCSAIPTLSEDAAADSTEVPEYLSTFAGHLIYGSATPYVEEVSTEPVYAMTFLVNKDGQFLIEDYYSDGTFTSKIITEERYQAILNEESFLDTYFYISLEPDFDFDIEGIPYSGYMKTIHTKTGYYTIPLTEKEWIRDNPSLMANGCDYDSHDWPETWSPYLKFCFRNCITCGERDERKHELHEDVCTTCGFDFNM